MSVPAVRRIVVGVDGSAQSAAALRWACREAGLRGAEVHAVHAREVPHTASYAGPSRARSPEDGDVDVLWRAVLPDSAAEVPVRTEVALGLAARILLERCDGADMLVLGTAGQAAHSGSDRGAGPVIRACLRRSPCPVVVISEPGAPRNRDASGRPSGARVPGQGGTAKSGAARDLGSIPIPAGLRV